MGSSSISTRAALELILLICSLSAFLCPVNGITLGSSVHCAVRRQISPCTCRVQEPSSHSSKSISVTCEGMINFQQVITALRDKFEKDVAISLKISYSALDDLPQLSFQQLGLSIQFLKLNYDNLSALPESVFSGLTRTESLSLADNSLSEVPRNVLNLMPKIKVLDLSRGRIRSIYSSDFQGLKSMHTLILNGNAIDHLDQHSLPSTLVKLHIGANKINHLNGTIKELNYIVWLFVNFNELSSLDSELPTESPNTKMTLLHAGSNRLIRPPKELKHFLALENLFLEHNQIVALDGALSTTKQLRNLDLSFNNLTVLSETEFAELEYLEDLKLEYNQISLLSNSIAALKSLKTLNLSHNHLEEFCFQEIRGLTKLVQVDLSHNGMKILSGKMENMVDMETRIFDLRLDNNRLTSLSGSLNTISGLIHLNLSHNLLEFISLQDLMGLDQLTELDISHNRLTTLDGMANTVLNSLEDLYVSHNRFITLESDFNGLPRLCKADFSYNQIVDLGAELADNTQCRLYGVNSTLRIYLQGNPAMCIPEVQPKIEKMESRNHTKVHGRSECPPPTTTTTTVLPPVSPSSTQPTSNDIILSPSPLPE